MRMSSLLSGIHEPDSKILIISSVCDLDPLNHDHRFVYGTLCRICVLPEVKSRLLGMPVWDHALIVVGIAARPLRAVKVWDAELGVARSHEYALFFRHGREICVPTVGVLELMKEAVDEVIES